MRAIVYDSARWSGTASRHDLVVTIDVVADDVIAGAWIATFVIRIERCGFNPLSPSAKKTSPDKAGEPGKR
jgi:hypothetical protein